MGKQATHRETLSGFKLFFNIGLTEHKCSHMLTGGPYPDIQMSVPFF